MKILLTNPPWLINNRYGVRAGSRWPFTLDYENNDRHYVPFPFFLAYAMSLLKKHKKDVALIDAVAEGMDVDLFIERAERICPDVVVFETSTPSFKNDILIAHRIKEKLKKIVIVFCGPHASTFSLELLDRHDFVDYILVGEYEYAMLELIEHLEVGSNLKDVPGLTYRENGKTAINKKRCAIKSLDSLPWPERGSLPIYNYNDGFCGLPEPNVQMMASRGCPYKCIFCLWPQVMYGNDLYRKRNPVDVIDEMEWLIDRYNFKAVYFDDDVFNVDRNFCENICDEINKRDINVPWAIMARADLMSKSLLENFADSGLYAIKYGVESGDQKVLDFCRKDMSLEKALRSIKITKALGIKVHLTFCLGLPGESKESIKKTIEFIEWAKPDSMQFSFATPFPGTTFFDYTKDKNWIKAREWSGFDGNYRCVSRTQELSAEDLERIKVDVNSYFNL